MKKFLVILLSCSFIVLVCALAMRGMTQDGDGYQVMESQYELDNGYCFTNFQVCGMKDKRLEEKINGSLNQYFYAMEEPWFETGYTEEIANVIHCNSERYLSVEYIFLYENYENGNDLHNIWHFCVTVDMTTGEVVFLEDLIDLSEEFALLVKNGNTLLYNGMVQEYDGEAVVESENLWITAEEWIKSENKMLNRMDTSQIIYKFRKYTREFLYGDYYREKGHDMYTTDQYLYHNYFYLTDGEIHFSQSDDYFFSTRYIDIDDIEEYLKVEKW